MYLDKLKQARGILEIANDLNKYDEETKDWAIRNSYELITQFLNEHERKWEPTALRSRLQEVKEAIEKQSPATRANLQGRFKIANMD